jgi:cytochrome bd-type quinol oxidase subunit 2
MKKTLKQILILMFLLAVLILPYFVFAADVTASKQPTNMTAPMKRLQNLTGPDKSWYQQTDKYEISRFVGTMISSFLELLGIIFIVLIIFAGYSWMTAAGDEQKLTRAQNTIRRAIIGLLIVIGSYASWKFIFDYLINNK